MDSDKTTAQTNGTRHEAEDAGAMSAADKAVYDAAGRIEARGEKLTVVALRAEAGGGSMSKITRVRRIYLADKAKRAMAPLDEIMSLGLRRAFIAETERIVAESRRTYEEQLGAAEEHANETAEIITNLERDIASVHEQLAALEAQNEQLRREMDHKDVAHAAKDAERETQLAKAVALASAADNARRDVEKKLVVAERDKAQAEMVSQTRADERRAVGEAFDKERARREAAEKTLAVAEAHAKAQAETTARMEHELVVVRAEAKEQRATAEKLRDESKAGQVAHRDLEAARRFAEESKASSEAKIAASAKALEVEHEMRTAAEKDSAVAEARAVERAEISARIERELRAEIAQLRTAIEQVRANAHTGAIAPSAEDAAPKKPDRQHKERK